MAEDNKQNAEPEIVFGLVAAVGTDLDLVKRFLSEALADVNYKSVPIQLSKLMHELPLSPWKISPKRLNSTDITNTLLREMSSENSSREGTHWHCWRWEPFGKHVKRKVEVQIILSRATPTF
jgi:hypothetical protein